MCTKSFEPLCWFAHPVRAVAHDCWVNRVHVQRDEFNAKGMPIVTSETLANLPPWYENLIKCRNDFHSWYRYLITIRVLVKAMTIEINEQEASVFWGIIYLKSLSSKDPDKSEILRRTNEQPTFYDLPALSDSEFQYSMSKLERLKAIEKIDDAKTLGALQRVIRLSSPKPLTEDCQRT